ncbi:MAG: tetratricopeptide repeat protein [Candidatus Omnitrophica bacterium]|nr:tetratricopeptide repeat protein [Candidatus Omnitrophota bacterium]
MERTIKMILIICAIIFAYPIYVNAQSQAVNALIEMGINYYKNGSYQEALHEFKKVLLVDPNNPTALEYIEKLTEPPIQKITEKKCYPQVKKSLTREEIITLTLEKLSRTSFEDEKTQLAQKYPEHYSPGFAQFQVPKEESISAQKEKSDAVNISGQLQLALGYEDDHLIAKRANFDLNEKNWRIQSQEGLNRKENTFDPAIYSRLKFNIDTPETQEGFGFHTGINFDPWTFIGKTDSITLTGDGGDSAKIQLKYWSNTSRILNESVYTLLNGDSFNIPEIKVKDGKTVPTTITSTWGNIFTIPELKIHREIQPVRELWVDYKTADVLSIRIFPFATEAQAYTSDDPLKLSNNHIYWEDSPWLRKWQPGNFNSNASPVSFRKGYWNNSISFMVRDSNGVRLTQLRGLTLEAKPTDYTKFSTSWASPKDPWQDYSDYDNIAGATRLVQSLSDNIKIGAIHTLRLGFNEDESSTDMRNNVLGVDALYEVIEGIKLAVEVAHSASEYDLTNSVFRSKARGNAYYFSLVTRYPGQSILDTSYDAIQPEKNEEFFSKIRLFASHMDEGFDPALANYHQTRRDQFWSRHIHFRRPLEYFYSGLYYPPSSYSDIKPFAIGDGIDIGRDVIGLRWEASWKEKVDNLFDIRNVHTTDGKYVETVTRDELTWHITDNLTGKILGIYQDMPKTKAAVDPFIYDAKTGIYLTDWSLTPIADGKDPSLKTGSFGLEYAFTDWLTVNGIYERTNDYTVAYDNFPRGILNSAQPSWVYYEAGKTYLRDRVFLYDQHLFPQPPYPFYDIFKIGVRFLPIEKLEIYLDYTRNEFEQAGPISDDINHFGVEIGYLPLKKLGLYLRYTYSMWNDLDRILAGDSKKVGHHNIFFETRYRFCEDDELVFDYGVSPNYPLLELTVADPFGGGLQTIDTQHIIRLYYRRRF